jgi:Tol biopolymer transport system component/predicted Ser/Thr protein kinase
MPLRAGTRLGPYEILAPLGAGGMGEVFEARDTRLDRRVAIKIMRPEFVGDSDRARFEREAHAIASLSHPHICTLYDVGHQDGVEFLVMEFLEGESLAGRLARGPIPITETLTFAVQMADALDRAHRQGIVHRDLKPANIMLTRAGAKLLDFGVARLLDTADEGSEGMTMPAALTGQGVILGTIAYMAPEQLENREVDARADVFAFGAVVYEMVTGRKAFDAPSQAAAIAAVLQSDPPPLRSIRPDAPPALDEMVKTCLAKNPEERWSSAHDLFLLIEGMRAEGANDAAAVAAPPRRRSERVAWILAALAIVAAGLLAARASWQRPDAPLDVLSVLPPAGTTLTIAEAPQVSPDGRTLAFVATDAAGKTQLYVRSRAALTARPLSETDDATLPFWSPDSLQLGFFAKGKLKTVELSGRRPEAIAVAPVPRGGTWSRDNVIVFVPYPDELPMQVPAAGGQVTRVALPASVNERRWFPCVLPDGRHYLYLAIEIAHRTAAAIRVASLDSTDVTDIAPSTSPAVYAEPGYLLFRRESALVAQRFDARRLRLEGPPVVVAENVGFNPIGYQGFYSASSNGVLAYLEPGPGSRLAWLDSAGHPAGTAGSPARYNSLSLSADGKRVVFDAADPQTGNIDIWALDLQNGISSRLTFDPAVDFYPIWSPRDDEVVFSSLRAGVLSLFRQRVGAPGSETAMKQPPEPKLATDWSRNGKFLVYSAFNPKTSWDIFVMPLTGVGGPIPFAATEAEERNGHFSPDGRWIAYTLQQGGIPEVYVQAFPATGAKWQVSNGGGRQPVWSADGRELFYVSPELRVIAAAVTSGSSGFAVGASRLVAQTRIASLERTNHGNSFAVTPDGKRFLVIENTDVATPITMVLNWTSALGKQ